MRVEIEGAELDVDFTIYPPCRGLREATTGLQLEPDEDGYVEIESVKAGGVEIIDLLHDKALKRIETAIINQEPEM